MLAALGQLFSSIHHPHLPAAINGDKPIAAADNLLKENPLAAAQIIFFIFVAEALGQKNQVKSGVPGDLLFDPLGLKPEDPETWEKVQLRELKNGRLAMLAIAGNFNYFIIIFLIF
jgi:light-harvesting complex I chlorophyll a/b binding protein 1